MFIPELFKGEFIQKAMGTFSLAQLVWLVVLFCFHLDIYNSSWLWYISICFKKNYKVLMPFFKFSFLLKIFITVCCLEYSFFSYFCNFFLLSNLASFKSRCTKNLMCLEREIDSSVSLSPAPATHCSLSVFPLKKIMILFSPHSVLCSPVLIYKSLLGQIHPILFSAACWFLRCSVELNCHSYAL